MPELRRDAYVGIAASIAGAVAGAVVASVVTAFVLSRVSGGAGSMLALLAGWFALSVAAGAATYAATAPFSQNAMPIAFSVFVWSGVLVYPGIVIHRVFAVAPEPLVVSGAVLAGLLSAVLVARIDPA